MQDENPIIGVITVVRSWVGDEAMRKERQGTRGPVGAALDRVRAALERNDVDGARDALAETEAALSAQLGKLRDALRAHDGLPAEDRTL